MTYRFEHLERAGRGGWGVVFRARDPITDRTVAVKLVPSADRAVVRRFIYECATLAQLEHPAVVGYLEDGRVSARYLYLAMEWVEGETLAERLARRGLTAAETILLGARLARSLGYLHRRGLVHRDVKPSNILLPGGDVAAAKLADFGCARFRCDPPEELETVGTPGFMPPEQVQGEVDPRSDVFALGCVLFKCLTGRTPFGTGSDATPIVARILVEPTPRPSTAGAGDVPVLLDQLVARTLARAAVDRPADGHALAGELLRVASASDAE